MWGRPRMSPLRLKLTITVMSISGVARDGGGGRQQVLSFATTSRMVLTGAGFPCAKADDGCSNAMAIGRNCETNLLCVIEAHFISAATCTFTILSGLATLPLCDPGGAFFSLSATSMPDATSPTTLYLPSRNEASPYTMKNCEFEEFGCPVEAMPTMPR